MLQWLWVPQRRHPGMKLIDAGQCSIQASMPLGLTCDADTGTCARLEPRYVGCECCSSSTGTWPVEFLHRLRGWLQDRGPLSTRRTSLLWACTSLRDHVQTACNDKHESPGVKQLRFPPGAKQPHSTQIGAAMRWPHSSNNCITLVLLINSLGRRYSDRVTCDRQCDQYFRAGCYYPRMACLTGNSPREREPWKPSSRYNSHSAVLFSCLPQHTNPRSARLGSIGKCT